jgi:hypothetical protein
MPVPRRSASGEFAFKRTQVIPVHVKVVFMSNFTEILGEFGVASLYDSSDTRNGNRGSSIKFSLNDEFVEVCYLIVTADGCFGDLI